MSHTCKPCTMKTTQNLLTVFFSLLIILTIFSCSTPMNEDGSLVEVISFAPKDKYFKSTLNSLHFMIETDPISDVDKAFSHIIKSYNLPVESAEIPDGEYTGESPYDAFDYKHWEKLTIKNGKIVEIDYNEIHKNGSDKESDKKYNKEMSVSGTSPNIAYPNMEKRLLEKQNILDVDATSGAT
jgi:major membrane immunogen (membrane-anchored lipoprotein)